MTLNFEKALLIAGLVLFSLYARAQDSDTTYWKIKFDPTLSFSQSAFSSNNTAGGVNTVGFSAIVSFDANYRKGKHSWDNRIGMLLGFSRVGEQGLRKNLDRLLVDTKYGYDLSKKWQVYGSINFLTQFANGFRYEVDPNTGLEEGTLISKFMSPGYLTLSPGFEYKPADFFFVRLSPFSPRFTFVLDTELFMDIPENYGVPIGETVRTEWAAAQILTEFNKDIFKNVNLFIRYLLFANYETLSDPKSIDHRLDLLITAKVNSWLDINLGGILLYDIDQDPDPQLSQVFGIGFTYKLQNYEEEE